MDNKNLILFDSLSRLEIALSVIKRRKKPDEFVRNGLIYILNELIKNHSPEIIKF